MLFILNSIYLGHCNTLNSAEKAIQIKKIMSNVSVTSSKSKHEKNITELSLELESLRAMNSSLRGYLEHLRGFKRNLAALNDNYMQLSKVNQQWIDGSTVKTL